MKKKYSDINLLQIMHIENKIWKASPYHWSFDNGKWNCTTYSSRTACHWQQSFLIDLDPGEEER